MSVIAPPPLLHLLHRAGGPWLAGWLVGSFLHCWHCAASGYHVVEWVKWRVTVRWPAVSEDVSHAALGQLKDYHIVSLTKSTLIALSIITAQVRTIFCLIVSLSCLDIDICLNDWTLISFDWLRAIARNVLLLKLEDTDVIITARSGSFHSATGTVGRSIRIYFISVSA